MSTLGSILHGLYAHYPAVCKQDIQELAAFILEMRRDELFLSLDQELTSEAEVRIKDLIEKRSAHHPLAYLLGYVDFYGCRIAVNEHVLIPRLETEILLDKVVKAVKGKSIQRVFDVCTGSGCLGIGFKKHYPETEVYLSDCCKQALQVARCNAESNQVEVKCLLGDLMDPFKGLGLADLVLCNPPYISDEEFADLEPSVRGFEPRTALTSGPSGLEIFQILSDILPNYMNPGALLALEIGSTQKNSINKIFSKHPWKNLCCEQDYAGLDRFIFLEIE